MLSERVRASRSCAPHWRSHAIHGVDRWAHACGTVRRCPLPVKLARWPALNGSTVRATWHWMHWLSNVDQSEPLSMAAFIAAIQTRQNSSARGWVLDIGMNIGMYSLVARAPVAPTFQLVGVDLQPHCVTLTRCHLGVSGLYGSRSELLNRFVTSGATPTASSPVLVPAGVCDSMASPTAVGGRRPDGRLRARSNTIAGGRYNASALVPVAPLQLGEYLRDRVEKGSRVAVTKIDTEGFEPLVLESLRPVWHLMDDVIMELQPLAWQHHNVSRDAAIETLRALVEANRYRIVSLPHARWREGSATLHKADISLVDPCRLRAAAGRMPKERGLHEAEIFSVEGLGGMVDAILSRAGRRAGLFYELLLTKRGQRCSST
eukprot:1999410-Prymnesium_polylepis.1